MKFQCLDEVTLDESHRKKGFGWKCTGGEKELKINYKVTKLKLEDIYSVGNTKYCINGKKFLPSHIGNQNGSSSMDHQIPVTSQSWSISIVNKISFAKITISG